MKKRILAVILVMCLTFTGMAVVPFEASAAGTLFVNNTSPGQDQAGINPGVSVAAVDDNYTFTFPAGLKWDTGNAWTSTTAFSRVGGGSTREYEFGVTLEALPVGEELMVSLCWSASMAAGANGIIFRIWHNQDWGPLIQVESGLPGQGGAIQNKTELFEDGIEHKIKISIAENALGNNDDNEITILLDGQHMLTFTRDVGMLIAGSPGCMMLVGCGGGSGAGGVGIAQRKITINATPVDVSYNNSSSLFTNLPDNARVNITGTDPQLTFDFPLGANWENGWAGTGSMRFARAGTRAYGFKFNILEQAANDDINIALSWAVDNTIAAANGLSLKLSNGYMYVYYGMGTSQDATLVPNSSMAISLNTVYSVNILIAEGPVEKYTDQEVKIYVNNVLLTSFIWAGRNDMLTAEGVNACELAVGCSGGSGTGGVGGAARKIWLDAAPLGVSKTVLTALYNEALTVYNSAQGDYGHAKALFATTLTAANAVLNNVNATSTEITNACYELRWAKALFERNAVRWEETDAVKADIIDILLNMKGSQLFPDADLDGDGEVTVMDLLIAKESLIGVPKVEVVSVTDYSGANDVELLNNAINGVAIMSYAAKARGENVKYVLLLENRNYMLSSAVVVLDAADIEINGAGASFMMTDYKIALYMQNCSNITFKNLNIDYNPLPFTQGTVKTATSSFGTQTITVTIDEGYNATAQFLNDRAVETGRILSNILDPNTNGPLEGASHTYAFKNATSAGGRDITLTQTEGSDSLNTSRLIQAGDRISFYFRGEGGIRTESCAQLGFENVNVYSSPGSGIHEGNGEGGTLFRNFNIIPGPKPAGATKERACTAGSDGMHFANQTTGPIIDNCTITHCGDDCINAQGFFFHVLAVNGNTVTVSPKWDTPPEIGETVEGYAEPNYNSLGTATITGFVKNENATQYETQILNIYKKYDSTIQSSTLVYEITLDTPIQGLSVGDHLSSLDRVSAGAVIKNSHFGFNRARGVVVKGSDVLIENNTFEGSTHPAIVAHADLLWCESGFVRNVTIKNNIINGGSVSSNLLKYQYVDQIGEILINILPCYKTVLGTFDVGFLNNKEHKNILIEGNTITNTQVYGIFVSNSNGVEIKNNTITNPFKNGLGQVGGMYNITPAGGIFVGVANDVTVTGNVVNAQSAAARGFTNAVQTYSCTGTVVTAPNTLNK